MPIDVDTFEQADEDELEGPTQPQLVLRFLSANSDQAFEPVEIAEATDVPKKSIHTVLSRLEDRNLVRHKGTFWAITDDPDRLGRLSQFEGTTSALNEQLGEEDPDEWMRETGDTPGPAADAEDDDEEQGGTE